jgi:SAM-dependent methyltransferase
MKKQFLNLGKQPIANGFLNKNQIKDEFFYNLGVGFDEKTKLVTQMEYIDLPLMFNENYAYRGSMSKTMVNHFKVLSNYIKEILIKPLYPKPKILEIGSNDGVFIKNFDPENIIAVEPCSNFAKETKNLGYTTYPEFWTVELANKIKEKYGKQDIIFSANCMCHIPDLNETFKAINLALSDDGIFIFEDPSLAEMINNNSYDQIYDEHAHIFSVIALDNILKENGLEIVGVKNLKVHGGSNRIFVKKINTSTPHKSVEQNKSHERVLGLDNFETFITFAKKVEQSKKDLISLLTQCKKENKKVISYGATSKSTTVFNYCNIGTDLIQYITDTTPEKQDKLSPGVHIPIISPEKGFDNSVDYAYLGALNFIKEISEKENDYLNNGGKFITHVPTIKII